MNTAINYSYIWRSRDRA